MRSLHRGVNSPQRLVSRGIAQNGRCCLKAMRTMDDFAVKDRLDIAHHIYNLIEG